MIPNDQFTFIVINLLIFLGLVGLVKPAWFIVLSRLPFILPQSKSPPITEASQRRARIWGGLTLVGALILWLLATL